MASKLFNEYQAAALLGISPQLLRYFAARQVKWKDKRKLTVAKVENDALYFDEAELKSYDIWLRAPWPSAEKTRPPLPEAIREEIRREASLECAVCKTSGQTGEAAHIDPVATGKCNHPHNLIWLCSNHHTKFDSGLFGPKGADNELIVSLKRVLLHFQRHAWLGLAEISKQIAGTLSLCVEMKAHLAKARDAGEVQAVEQVAKEVLALLPTLAAQSTLDAVQPTLSKLMAGMSAAGGGTGASTEAQLDVAAQLEVEFLLNSGLKQCPLCDGTKSHNGYECPVCVGDGAIPRDLDPDLDEFQMVTCGLCEGARHYEGEDCPACGGEGALERRFAERIDFSRYKSVECRLCKGEKVWDGEQCPVCAGEGEVPRHYADQVDLNQYDLVECPLCDGEGRHEGDECPVCNGDKRMQQRYADRVELSDYRLCQCPVCSGTRQHFGDDCPACAGEGRMLGRDADRLDTGRYRMVACPRCDGSRMVDGDECQACGGNGSMLAMYAERFE
ncbi:HNH endonuclease [Roseateles sp. DB2]|uniref:HNH endonuclease n=1 Tax=Roseateles sp. DB2 TaxID=3453717 RepID=UPI003EEDF698